MRMRAWMTVVDVACTTATACGGRGDGDADGGDTAAVAELQEQLDGAVAERDAALSEQKRLAGQVGDLQARLDAAQEAPPATNPPVDTIPEPTDPPQTTEVPATEPPVETLPADEPGAPDASEWVAPIGDVSVIDLPAGEPGRVSVVAQTSTLTSSGSIPVVVRNNTDGVIGGIEATGIIRDSSGALVVSGSSQGFKPAVVRPGEIAWGYVYFDYDAEMTADATVELSATGDGPPEFYAPVRITEINAGGDGIIGVLTNDSSVDVNLIGIDAVCFDADGALLNTVQTFADQDEIVDGDTGSFTVSLYGDPCPIALLSAAGWTV